MIKKQVILLNQCVAQVKGNVVSDMDGEKVMLSIKNGKYYNLGEVGGVIWERIEKPIPVTELVTTLISEYEVEQLQCEGQVLSFLEMLLEEGLVEVK
ncbi:lasso peptide biosynthesis PqqD family chaperone [Bacillus mobilis]|uniref:Metallophosphoesterase n=2 Tax=Bacillus cereus group TaxID=86661 RepID=A0A1C4E9U9_BACCE|nr:MULTISPECIES: lasso peptide biosynthesis PqqD family chaperone [Bacillus cereus group]MCU5594361.1 lasso peptide biosynthesis PqqD family chaperone [Bacillus mobilis]MCU5736461.1 lasso peptide biosynthesis PqqD family chaperone [Bacillus mobilis]MCU9560203.1 lasso peptide biosynthesis PqqD family chaperone [Bacillus mobilis]OKA37015.1 metallophosphoesterase [Bacillus cereus]OKA41424.1 metallophosphoesterase [Bacillus cereus]